jgi:hypothetical protein
MNTRYKEYCKSAKCKKSQHNENQTKYNFNKFLLQTREKKIQIPLLSQDKQRKLK